MKRYWLHALVLLVPAALYSTGLDYGRPRPEYSPSTVQNMWLNPATVYHPDAFAYVGIAYRMLLHDDWNPHYYHNPPLNIYTNIVLFALAGAERMPHDASLGDRSIAPFQLYVMSQYLSALYMLLTAALTYATGRAAFHRAAGALAAGIVALSPLMVQHAHYATPNAQTMMLSTAALLAALMLLRGRYTLPPGMVYFIAGLLVGLTMAARYNAVVVGMVTGLVMLTDGWQRRRWQPVILGFAAMPLGLLIGVPGLVFARSEVVDQIRAIMRWYQEQGGGDGFTAGRGWQSIVYHWRYTILMVVGPVAALAALFGLIVTQRRWRTEQWREAWIGAVLAAYMLLYTVLVLPGRRLQANLLFPLIVPLALLAAYAAVGLWQRTGRRRLAAVGLAAALLIWPGVLSALFTYRIVTPDNRERAQAWIYEHIPHGTTIHVLGPYNVPVDPLDYDVTVSYAREVGPDRLQQEDAQIIVYSDSYPFAVLRDSAVSSDAGITRETAIRAILETEWIELARFERLPWPGDHLPPDDVSYWHQMEIVIYCNPANCPVRGET